MIVRAAQIDMVIVTVIDNIPNRLRGNRVAIIRLIYTQYLAHLLGRSRKR